MATTETTRQVQLELGQLFNQWLRISSPLQHLHLIREKIVSVRPRHIDLINISAQFSWVL